MVVDLRRLRPAIPRPVSMQKPASLRLTEAVRMRRTRTWSLVRLLRHAIGIAAVVGFFATRSAGIPAASMVLFGLMALGYLLLSFEVEDPERRGG